MLSIDDTEQSECFTRPRKLSKLQDLTKRYCLIQKQRNLDFLHALKSVKIQQKKLLSLSKLKDLEIRTKQRHSHQLLSGLKYLWSKNFSLSFEQPSFNHRSMSHSGYAFSANALASRSPDRKFNQTQRLKEQIKALEVKLQKESAKHKKELKMKLNQATNKFKKEINREKSKFEREKKAKESFNETIKAMKTKFKSQKSTNDAKLRKESQRYQRELTKVIKSFDTKIAKMRKKNFEVQNSTKKQYLEKIAIFKKNVNFDERETQYFKIIEKLKDEVQELKRQRGIDRIFLLTLNILKSRQKKNFDSLKHNAFDDSTNFEVKKIGRVLNLKLNEVKKSVFAGLSRYSQKKDNKIRKLAIYLTKNHALRLKEGFQTLAMNSSSVEIGASQQKVYRLSSIFNKLREKRKREIIRPLKKVAKLRSKDNQDLETTLASFTSSMSQLKLRTMSIGFERLKSIKKNDDVIDKLLAASKISQIISQHEALTKQSTISQILNATNLYENDFQNKVAGTRILCRILQRTKKKRQRALYQVLKPAQVGAIQKHEESFYNDESFLPECSFLLNNLNNKKVMFDCESQTEDSIFKNSNKTKNTDAQTQTYKLRRMSTNRYTQTQSKWMIDKQISSVPFTREHSSQSNPVGKSIGIQNVVSMKSCGTRIKRTTLEIAKMSKTSQTQFSKKKSVLCDATPCVLNKLSSCVKQTRNAGINTRINSKGILVNEASFASDSADKSSSINKSSLIDSSLATITYDKKKSKRYGTPCYSKERKLTLNLSGKDMMLRDSTLVGVDMKDKGTEAPVWSNPIKQTQCSVKSFMESKRSRTDLTSDHIDVLEVNQRVKIKKKNQYVQTFSESTKIGSPSFIAEIKANEKIQLSSVDELPKESSEMGTEKFNPSKLLESEVICQGSVQIEEPFDYKDTSVERSKDQKLPLAPLKSPSPQKVRPEKAETSTSRFVPEGRSRNRAKTLATSVISKGSLTDQLLQELDQIDKIMVSNIEKNNAGSHTPNRVGFAVPHNKEVQKFESQLFKPSRHHLQLKIDNPDILGPNMFSKRQSNPELSSRTKSKTNLDQSAKKYMKVKSKKSPGAGMVTPSSRTPKGQRPKSFMMKFPLATPGGKTKHKPNKNHSKSINPFKSRSTFVSPAEGSKKFRKTHRTTSTQFDPKIFEKYIRRSYKFIRTTANKFSSCVPKTKNKNESCVKAKKVMKDKSTSKELIDLNSDLQALFVQQEVNLEDDYNRMFENQLEQAIESSYDEQNDINLSHILIGNDSTEYGTDTRDSKSQFKNHSKNSESAKMSEAQANFGGAHNKKAGRKPRESLVAGLEIMKKIFAKKNLENFGKKSGFKCLFEPMKGVLINYYQGFDTLLKFVFNLETRKKSRAFVVILQYSVVTDRNLYRSQLGLTVIDSILKNRKIQSFCDLKGRISVIGSWNHLSKTRSHYEVKGEDSDEAVVESRDKLGLSKLEVVLKDGHQSQQEGDRLALSEDSKSEGGKGLKRELKSLRFQARVLQKIKQSKGLGRIVGRFERAELRLAFYDLVN